MIEMMRNVEFDLGYIDDVRNFRWAECIAAELNGPACAPKLSTGLGTGGATLQGPVFSISL